MTRRTPRHRTSSSLLVAALAFATAGLAVHVSLAASARGGPQAEGRARAVARPPVDPPTVLADAAAPPASRLQALE